MAHFKSVVTDIGAEKIAAIVAGGGKLSLTRAAVGSGRTDSDRAAMTALVKEENAEIQTGDLEVTTSGGMTVLRLPVQVTNKGQSVPLPVREVGLYSQDAEGEYLFAVSWLDGTVKLRLLRFGDLLKLQNVLEKVRPPVNQHGSSPSPAPGLPHWRAPGSRLFR